jgi:SAM-dependent methyltransferase
MATAWQTLDWYDAPKYYDAVFDEGTEQEAAFIAGVFERHAAPANVRRGAAARSRRAPRVLEPACGAGRRVEALAQRGFAVSGFDLSEPMLEHARERTRALRPRPKLFVAAMQDFASDERFDLAHCLVSTFKYLASERDAKRHLELVAEHLVPGGVYVLGFHLTEYADERMNRERWKAKRDGFEVVCTIEGWPADKRKRTEAVRSRLVVQEGGETKRLETNWTFRTYDARQVRALLRSVPTLEHVATYDFTHDLESPRELSDEQLDIVLVLRKR